MFVVTGLGRSGTTYVAHLLSALGVPTTHQVAFLLTPTWSSLQSHGDVSWLAAPHLIALPAGMPVAHLIRDPRKVIPSWAGADHGAGGVTSPYMRYAAQHCGFDYFGEEDLHVRALRLWYAWNALIRTQAPAAPLFRLEDLTHNVASVQALAQHLGFPVAPARIEDALASVPRDTNTYATLSSEWHAQPAPESLREALDNAALSEGYPA